MNIPDSNPKSSVRQPPAGKGGQGAAPVVGDSSLSAAVAHIKSDHMERKDTMRGGSK